MLFNPGTDIYFGEHRKDCEDGDDESRIRKHWTLARTGPRWSVGLGLGGGPNRMVLRRGGPHTGSLLLLKQS